MMFLRTRSRRSVGILTVLILILTSGNALASVSVDAPAPRPRVEAASAVLMDAATDEILFTKAPNQRRAIASTTKIMTAIVVIERARLGAKLRVPAAVTRVGESSAELVRGERRTVQQLLYAMMLQSANDAAAALAIYVGRSLRGFVAMMNRKAAGLGAKRTHFANPHGLTAPRNYSTARDLAVIAAYGLKNPIFSRVVKTKQAKIPGPGRKYSRVFVNHNRLLWDFRGAIGVKTGYTVPAGNCLVAAARRGPTTLVAVALGSPSAAAAYRTTVSLLRYGFSGYRSEQLLTEGEICARLPVTGLAGDTVNLLAARTVTARLFGGRSGTTVTAVVSKQASLPIAKGEVLGEAQVRRDGAVLATAQLVAERDVDAPNFWDRLAGVWSQGLRQLPTRASAQGALR